MYTIIYSATPAKRKLITTQCTVKSCKVLNCLICQTVWRISWWIMNFLINFILILIYIFFHFTIIIATLLIARGNNIYAHVLFFDFYMQNIQYYELHSVNWPSQIPQTMEPWDFAAIFIIWFIFSGRRELYAVIAYPVWNIIQARGVRWIRMISLHNIVSLVHPLRVQLSSMQV